jgi:hypothetical protein
MSAASVEEPKVIDADVGKSGKTTIGRMAPHHQV